MIGIGAQAEGLCLRSRAAPNLPLLDADTKGFGLSLAGQTPTERKFKLVSGTVGSQAGWSFRVTRSLSPCVGRSFH